MKLTRLLGLTAIAVALSAAHFAAAAPMYSQNFDADDTANWTVNNNNIGTNAANFYFDYSTIGIPSAPNSGGTTRGLKVGANLATAPASGIPGISVSPTGKSFTGNYKLKYDMWSNYIGPLDVGATGSTMLANAGILTSGTAANYPGVADSVWFGATGDGQSAADYRAYSSQVPTSHLDAGDAFTTYAAGSRNSSNALYTGLFPAGQTAPGSQAALPTQTLSTPAGATGFRWIAAEIEKSGNIVTWKLNGTLIATVNTTNFTTATAGNNILFGYADTNSTTNSNSANMVALQFGLFDNVVVTPEPGSLALAMLAGVGAIACGRRRR